MAASGGSSSGTDTSRAQCSKSIGKRYCEVASCWSSDDGADGSFRFPTGDPFRLAAWKRWISLKVFTKYKHYNEYLNEQYFKFVEVHTIQ